VIDILGAGFERCKGEGSGKNTEKCKELHLGIILSLTIVMLCYLIAKR
jgi:hypothetical protein